MPSLKSRICLACLIVISALVFLLPTFLPSSAGLARLLPAAHINLGLDLKGGVQLTLGVDTEKAVQAALNSAGQHLRQRAVEEGMGVLGPRQLSGGGLYLVLTKASQAQDLRALAAKNFPQLVLRENTTPTGEARTLAVALDFTPEFAASTKALAMEQVLKTITSRIDLFGVAEPDIRKHSGDRILLQLPGLTNVERAVHLVGQAAQLSFHLVRDDVDAQRVPPVGTALFTPHGASMGGVGPLLLETAPLLRGADVSDARPSFDDKGSPTVSLSFTPAAGDVFERFTREHVGRRLAIVLDGQVRSAPVIRDRIAGGTASISGGFTSAEAHDLAIALRSGSLAAPVRVLEERSVGPALGQASIVSGLLAAVAGTVAVMVIMPLRYGASGMLANGMLFCTLSLLMAGMAAVGATLTLPGIAGVVLTVGMAVDANVLIFERIREELAKGLAPVKALAAGFERANLSIIDSNLTTIIVAGILYHFGTGPVRGFAVTLILGIVASMVTAIFLCRVAMDVWMRCTGGTGLGISGPLRLQGITDALSRIPFLRYAKGLGVVSALVVVAATWLATAQGGLRYGVDFAGGVAVQARFSEPVQDTELKGVLAVLRLKDVTTQAYGDDGRVWMISFAMPGMADTPGMTDMAGTSGMEPQELGSRVRATLEAGFDQGGQQVFVDKLEMVGPKAGSDLRTSALEAIYYAMLLITVYISGRFEQRWGVAALLAASLSGAMLFLQWAGVPVEWRLVASLGVALTLCWRLRLAFSAGAMASLLFDMAVTLSLLIFLGQEIDLNIVAALLTILGYSLNDTIIIYDRIREVLRREDAGRLRPLAVIVEESLGETMSRTLLTGGTTLAAALALYLLGGPVIHGFALTIFIGVIVGTFSSLFVAAPLLPLLGESAAFKVAVTPLVYERPGPAGVV